MTEKREAPDLLGVGDCARAVHRDVSTTRSYLAAMWLRRVPGVLKVSNGALVLKPNELPRLEREVAARRRHED